MPLQIIRQDITKMEVDAIVNPSNREMVGYSGIDLLVHQKGGKELDEICERLAPLELGFAEITPAFGLPCRWIIHTSGPVWDGGEYGERALLKSCYLESLKLAKRSHCETVAFPLISSGAYGYPKRQVLRHAVQAITEFLETNEMMVYLCVFDSDSYEFSKTLYEDLSNFITDRIAVPAPCSSETLSMPIFRSAVPPKNSSLEAYLEEMDAGFAETLFSLIDEKGMTDVECYKKANVSKKTFSKIKCNPGYKPSKPTVVAFAVALQLNLEETQHLLSTVGMTLSHSSKFDLIIEYFILNGVYDIFEINEALFEFDQVLLGC